MPQIHPKLQAGGDLGDLMYKVGSARKPSAEADNFVGEIGDLFYSMRDTKLRISDGVTPGGWYIIPDFEDVDTDLLPSPGVTINIGGPELYFGDLYVQTGNFGDVNISGDLIVQGDQVVNNYVVNQLFTINDGASNGGDGAGIQIYLTENNYATLTYDLSSDTFVFNKNITVNTVYGDQVGDIYADDGTSQILENGTDGTDAWFKGYVYGQVSDISNHRLGELLDVDTTDVADGSVIKYNAANNVWEVGTDNTGTGGTGSVTEYLDELLDVKTSGVDTPTNGQILIYDYDDSLWKPGNVTDTAGYIKYINQLWDVDTATNAPADGQPLVWDSNTNNWVPGTVPSTFQGNQNVFLTIDADIGETSADLWYDRLSIQGGDYIRTTIVGDSLVIDWDGPDPTTGGGGTSNVQYINDLVDVDTDGDEAPNNNDVLSWDSSRGLWLPRSISAATGGGAEVINDLSDVDTTGYDAPQNDEVLTWDNARQLWVPKRVDGFGWTINTGGYYVTNKFYIGGVEIPIRDIGINPDGEISVEPATFDPALSATGQSLKWDQAATQFTVTVDNPSDYPSNHIASVESLTSTAGMHTTISDYSTTGPSVTPDGGVDWTQTFTTNATAKIYSNGTGATGGTASGTVAFADSTPTTHGTTADVQFNWGNIGATINFTTPTGASFLQSYSSVAYNVSITGLHDSSNAAVTVTPTGGTLSNSEGSGVLTLTEEMLPGSTSTATVDLSVTFTRPAAVTGTEYTHTITDSATISTGNFVYDSFYLWTTSVYVLPGNSDVIDGTGFASGVTSLGDETYQLATFINNTDSSPRAFWFGVRTSATQPSSFNTGVDSTFLSAVAVTNGGTIDLEPTNPPAGYTAESYTLYGITLQPGLTYVRIN